MDLVPDKAPIYGGEAIYLQLHLSSFPPLSQKELDEGKFYFVFLGSKLRHVTPARTTWNPDSLTLSSHIPAHDKAEPVCLTAYVTYLGEERSISSSKFEYVSDSAHQMAAFLSDSVNNCDALSELEQVCEERFNLTTEAQANLDSRLTAAFKALHRSSDWSIVGSRSKELEQQETLLHFAARLGLRQMMEELLTLPGSLLALHTPNLDGFLPDDVASSTGFLELAEKLAMARKQACNKNSCDRQAVAISKPLSGRDSKKPPVVTTNLSWSYRDLDYDIEELERLISDSSCSIEEGKKSLENMDQISRSHSEGSESEHSEENTTERTIPRINVTSYSPRPTRVLEKNLERLHDIQEGIQRLREMSYKNMGIKRKQKGLTTRLSSSCPSLTPELTLTGINEEPDENGRRLDPTTMSSYSLPQKTYLSCPGAKDPIKAVTLAEATNVKIQVNDITPSSSQEFLNLANTNEDKFQTVKIHTNTSSSKAHIGGTSSQRCAQKTGKKGLPRRKSWSAMHEGDSGDGEEVLRSMSLSSLNSDPEEAFYDAVDGPSFTIQEIETEQREHKPPRYGDFSHEKQRSFSAGSEEIAHVSLSSQGSRSSGHSMTNISGSAKHHKESKGSDGSDPGSKSPIRLLEPWSPLQKSVSTPSIFAAEGFEDVAEGGNGLFNFNPLHMCELDDELNVAMMPEDEEPSFHMMAQVSLADLLRGYQNHFTGQDSDDDKPFGKRKKRGSLFFRKRKSKHEEKDKENKKSAHQFVSICYSIAADCDVCNKPLANKPALRCENCLVTVHSSSCKDQIVDCTKFKSSRVKSLNPSTFKERSSVPMLHVPTSRVPHYPYRYRHLIRPVSQNMTHLVNNKSQNSSQSIKDKKNDSAPGTKMRSQPQGTSTVDGLVKTSSSISTGVPNRAYTPRGSTQWRRVATKLGVNKVINEEKEADPMDDTNTNIVDVNSASMESLEDSTQEFCDLEDDPVLQLIDEEPEVWSTTVDKKVLKKLKDKEVKKQEAIYELILTEKHHCLTLKIMQKVFAQGMSKEVGLTKDLVDRIFPCLEELLEIHSGFLRKLRERQRQDRTVERIGDILVEQFQGETAIQLKSAYGQFCSKHKEALSLYKDILKTDRKFQNFIKRCSLIPVCKSRRIPECILLVTQRVTKYPLLIDSLLKATKDNKSEQCILEESLSNVKDIISQINTQVEENERQQRLLEIYNKVDAKSTAYFRG
ncbi:rho guanine nucleotide exchange factor 28-like isoform X3 [Tachypleus tridentatus]|uniref:rho guanine nucleotide exchange factor 28-like isoform X3 n=2 Tax=Tachypleus tridentatus TaxID=6853 RepID=UPI003FD5CAC8